MYIHIRITVAKYLSIYFKLYRRKQKKRKKKKEEKCNTQKNIEITSTSSQSLMFMFSVQYSMFSVHVHVHTDAKIYGLPLKIYYVLQLLSRICFHSCDEKKVVQQKEKYNEKKKNV